MRLLGSLDVVLATPGAALFVEGGAIKHISFARLIIDECHQRETWCGDSPPFIESHGRPSHLPGPMCIFRVATRYTNNRRNLGTYTTRYVWGLTGTPMTSSIDDLEVRLKNRRERRAFLF